MTVKELMAAFKATRGSLSTRPLARHREAAKNDPRTARARAGLAEQGVSTHVGSDGGVYVDSIEQPPAPLAHRTVTDTESHAAIERLTEDNRRAALNTSVPPTAVAVETKTPIGPVPGQAVVYDYGGQHRDSFPSPEATKARRTRKPTPCSCQCRRAEARRAADGRLLNGCNPGRPCGHKGCGLAAE